MNVVPADFHIDVGNCDRALVNYIRITVRAFVVDELRSGALQHGIVVAVHNPDAVHDTRDEASIRAATDMTRVGHSYAALRFGSSDERVRSWLTERAGDGSVKMVLIFPGERLLFVTMVPLRNGVSFHQIADAAN